ncbi:hypothetical protein FXO37_31914 [Capsicum annuum]|nr:hypothetical protein FXO37_31914 [Capsicum annuum]
MATSLTMTARRAAAFTGFPPQALGLLFSTANRPPKVNCWKEPMNIILPNGRTNTLCDCIFVWLGPAFL